MSTSGPSSTQRYSGETAGAETARSEPDSALVEQARREIAAIAAEIEQLARSEVSPAEFYHHYLPRVVSALAAGGGAIWMQSETGQLALEYQVNLAAAQLEGEERQARHGRLVLQSIKAGVPVLAPPQSGAAGDEAGNPTDFLLLLCPLSAGEQVCGLVEVFQRADGGPATQRGWLRFLAQMAELASEYLKSQRLRHYSDRQQLWQQLEGYISRVHQGLDPRTTAYTIANDGRRLIGCDRVSVLLARGRRWRVEATSGVDRVETRAAHVRLMESLVEVVAAAGEPLWYHGDMRNIPPQIEKSLHELVDETHANAMAVVLLRRPVPPRTDESRMQEAAPVIGAIVIEQLQSQPPPGGLANRTQAVADHGAAALANALDHREIFLLPLWQTLGKAKVIVSARHLPKLVLALIALAALVATLLLVPASFEVEGRGTLEPVIRREVFAGIDGQVDEVPVVDGQTVQAGDPLVRLRSTSDLDVAMADLVGKRLAAHEKIVSIERSLLGEERITAEEQDRLSGELFQLRKLQESLDNQIKLYQDKHKQLTVTSPIDGQVVTWQVRDRLLHRPVRQGQRLVTVVDPTGEWELEVHMPERRMGHVNHARAELQKDLEVQFMLATHPGTEFIGRIKAVDEVAQEREEEGSTVLVRVAVDKAKLPELRPGASVTARIRCGRAPLGYVWLHDVIEFVQSQILFRL
jgi:multidrug efflux pump subunit AcrA (membrane-fusion protein)